MKNKLALLFISIAFTFAAQAQTVTVEIDFGGEKTNETHQIEWFEGITAMTALQSCATIESYPVKKYIFVTTINGVKTERTVKAWYYTVNGDSTNTLAFKYVLKPNDKVRWIYKTDVCSPKERKKQCVK